MSNFKATIGIEVHTELNTKSKMFSSSPVSSYDEPNTNINEIDLGFPGTLPSPNKAAVVKAIQLASALNMKIDENLCFDRKNYFYQDLPKGYQITQQYYPIGKKGVIKLKTKDIRVERIHIEEDTAKQNMIDQHLCLDYNRCGVPLIEIVSHPDIATAEEAVEYLSSLRRILVFLNISDGKMEDGSFRADINISVAPIDAKVLGTKVEIKNINSFANVAKAINFEFQRQVKELNASNIINQETRRWDETSNQTIFMRKKSDAVDYHYFREPNIVQINIAPLIKETIANLGELPDQIKNQLIQKGVQTNIIEQLLDNFDLFKIFKYVNDQINNPIMVTTWIVVELQALLKNNKQSINNVNHDFLDKSIEMLKLLQSQEINGKQAKTIFEQIYLTHKDAKTIIKELGFQQVKDKDTLTSLLTKYLDANPEMVKQHKERPDRVEKFFIGLLMKDTKGQANPVIANDILINLLRTYNN